MHEIETQTVDLRVIFTEKAIEAIDWNIGEKCIESRTERLVEFGERNI